MQDIRNESPDFPVIGVGASAGGLVALQSLLAGVTDDASMAFVVIQHLAPDHPSMMAELVGRSTSLRTQQLVQDTDIEAGVVYFLPPGGHALMDGTTLRRVDPDAPRGHRLPVDRFFASLARVMGPRAVALILSGTGSDGTLGAAAVHDAGGLVLAQEPMEAEHRGMPQSAIKSGCVNATLRVQELVPAVVRYLQEGLADGGWEPSSDTEGDFEAILEHLHAHTRQDFSLYRASTIRRRIQRRISLSQLESTAEYLELLQRQPDEIARLYQDIFIGVTRFFRDPESWEALGDLLLQEHIPQAGIADPLRVWVPGCSTGQEAVTVAILLTELFERQGREPTFQIFATDVDQRAIDRARRAAYTDTTLKGLSKERRRRFFIEREDGFFPITELRERIVYSVQDMIGDPPFSRLALVTCRNVLIYLKPRAQRQALALFHFALAQGGVLFLGSAETPNSQPDLFDARDSSHRIYQRAASTSSLELPQVPVARIRERGAGRLPQADPSEATQRVLLKHCTPAALLIDAQDRILYEHGETEAYIGRPRGMPTQNLHDLVHDPLRGRVSRVIAEARETGELSNMHAALGNQGRQFVRIEARPLSDGRAGPGWIVVTFHPTAPPGTNEETGSMVDEALVEQLREELRETRFDLQAVIEEHESSTEELKASTEEAMSMNEELQSSNEELETSREELQSLNEELGTVNAELQGKLQELEQAHDDLDNLITSTRIPTLFLDSNRHIKRFTPAMRELMSLIPSDVGRPIDHLAQRFVDAHLLEDIDQVLDTLAPSQREVETDDGRCLVRRIHPYRTGSDHIGGVVITFVDVTSLRDAKAEADRRLVELEQVYASSPTALAFVDREHRYVRVNKQMARINGLPVEEHIDRTLASVLGDQADAFQAICEQVVETGEPIKDRTVSFTPAGRETRHSYLASYHPLSDGQGTIRGTLAAAVDITERETLRARVEAERERYQVLLDVLEGGVVVLDQDGIITFANAVAKQLLGGEALGKTLMSLWPAAAPAVERLRSTNQGPIQSELCWLRERIRLKVSGRSFGAGTGGLLLLTDVSEEIQLAEKLQAELKMEALARLAAGVAHDFNNLLQGVLGHAENIEDQTDDPSVHREAQGIYATVSQAGDIVGQLVRVGRQGVDQSEPAASVVRTVKSSIDMARASYPKALRLETDLPDGDWSVDLSTAELVQLTINLLTNARQAARPDTEGTVRVSVHPPDGTNELCLEIEDDGVGMSEEVRKRLFEPYFTTREQDEGTGLGLSVVHGIVQRADGRIVVRSKPSKGTTVSVWLPVRDEGPTQPTSPPAQPPQGRGECVFVVDDEARTLRAMRRLLGSRGYEVQCFVNPEEALSAIAADPHSLDALVTDLGMPQMSGNHLIDEVRELRVDLPIVVFTGNLTSLFGDVPDDVEVLRKPVSSRRLVVALQRALERLDASSEGPGD